MKKLRMNQLMLNNLEHMFLKALQKEELKKKSEATGDLTVYEISNKITKVSKN